MASYFNKFLILIFICSTSTVKSNDSILKTYKVGAFNYYPAIFKDNDNAIKGFYVDAFREIEKNENIKFEYVYGSWNEGIEKLKNGELDILTSVAYTPERAKYMYYSTNSLLTEWGELYVQSSSEINGILDVANKKIAIMKSDVNGQNFINLTKKFNIACEFIEFQSFEEIFEAISNKSVDGGVVNNTFGAAKQHLYEVRTSDVIFNPFDIFITVSLKNNVDILNIFNRYLHKWKHEKNSIFKDAREKWTRKEINQIYIFPSWLKFTLLTFFGLISIALIFIIVLKKQIKKATKKILERENKLIESESKFRNYVNVSPDGIFVANNAGKILEINNAASTITGYTTEELLTMSVADLQPKETLEQDMLEFEKLKSNGFVNCEIGLQYKNGEKGWWSINAVKINENCLLGFVRDITERKNDVILLQDKNYEIEAQNEEYRQLNEELNNTQLRINESETQFRLVFENNEDAIVWADSITGNILKCNNAAFKLFERTENEIIGQNITILHPPQKKEFYSNSFKNSISNKDLSNQEFEIITKNGKIIQVEITASLINIGHKNINQGIFRVITDRIENEKLQKEIKLAETAAKIKQQFLANMSHEIRTPLSGIIGMTDILYKTHLDAHQKDYVETIKYSSETLLSIINDILDLSKIEAGKMEIFNKLININQLKTKILNTYESICKNKNLQFEVNIKPDVPLEFFGDEKRLMQIINNLISNAIKFTNNGYIHINFSKDCNIINNEVILKVEVIDSGIGIKKEDQTKLFTKFSQVDSSLSRTHEGTGLGLAICKELAYLMNGSIGLISKEGKGSNFYLTLKVLTSNANSENIIENKTLENASTVNASILLVEDKFVNRKVIGIMLENMGCKVEFAQNGLEAIENFEEHKFDIILMDIQMPIMDGIEATKNLKEKFRILPPIIGLSANAMEGDAEKYITLGLDDYLSKPATMEQLKEKITKWLNKQTL